MPINDFCFEGKDRQYWLNKVKGLSYKGGAGPDDDYETMIVADDDGAWIRNGGIENPMEEKARAGQMMYRFVATKVWAKYQDGAIHGEWWVTDNDFYTLEGHALDHGYTLAQAASNLLAIPPNWGDCGFYGRARLTETIRAWTGHGKPATSKLTPDHTREQRRAAGSVLKYPLRHLEIKQWFLPGGRELLAPVMPIDGTMKSAM